LHGVSDRMPGVPGWLPPRVWQAGHCCRADLFARDRIVGSWHGTDQARCLLSSCYLGVSGLFATAVFDAKRTCQFVGRKLVK